MFHLDFLAQQGTEGDDKKENQHGPGQEIPGGEINPVNHEPGLFRQVPIPDDQELGKEKIPVGQTKGQEQLAQIMKLIFLDKISQSKVLTEMMERKIKAARAL